MKMQVVVVGGGIAGIGAALALSGPGRSVKVIERDPPPPDVSMNELFDVWDRKGATQLRQSHGFLARLVNLIRNRYPDLAEALFEAGAREVHLADTLGPGLKQRHRPEPGDEDLSTLICRRTTLEYVMRGYAEKRPGVTFMTATVATGLLVEQHDDGIPSAKSVVIQTADAGQQELEADLIVDASGRNTGFPDWLAEHGIAPETEEAPVGILYFTRHYRLLPGQTEPAAGLLLADIDCIRCVVFAGDGGNFSITLMVPEAETLLRQRVVHPEVFDRICAAFPMAAPWIDPARAAPVSKVFGMGNLKSHWRHWVKGDRPLIKNFFALGDATIRTNPAFGRGCTFGFVHAHLLADILREIEDPTARAKAFDARTNAELRRHYDAMVNRDAMTIKRAEQIQDPGYRPGVRDRLMRSFAEKGLARAIAGDLRVRRAFMRGLHMLDGPNDWRKKPDVLLRILLMWAKPKNAKTEPGAQTTPLRDRKGVIALLDQA